MTALETYIRDQLGVADYEEQHEEFGVIPMTDAPFAGQPSAHVLNIGTAGGRTKPSTGYTFQRIQRQSRQLAQVLATTNSPIAATTLPNKRFELFDSVFLNVLFTKMSWVRLNIPCRLPISSCIFRVMSAG